jgi:hypothetical protein
MAYGYLWIIYTGGMRDFTRKDAGSWDAVVQWGYIQMHFFTTEPCNVTVVNRVFFFLNPEMAKSLVGEFAYNSPKGSTGIIPLLNVGIEYSVTEREA